MKFTHETIERNVGWLAVLVVLVVRSRPRSPSPD
jgi:hypothetical protein